MKIILWVHRERLEDLYKCIKNAEGCDEPIKVSLDQIGIQWIQIMIDYDTFVFLQDQNAVRIY